MMVLSRVGNEKIYPLWSNLKTQRIEPTIDLVLNSGFSIN